MKIAVVIGAAALAVNLCAGGRTAADENSSAVPDLTIYLGKAGAMLEFQAKALATHMLAEAEVHVAWRGGEPKPDPAGGFVVHPVFAEPPPTECDSFVTARGYPFGNGIHGITVFSDRIQGLARQFAVEEFKLTAHVLVHEIGHVLERLDHHSDTGIMKARWSRADFQAMTRRPLPFAAEDLARIRGTLAELPRTALNQGGYPAGTSQRH